MFKITGLTIKYSDRIHDICLFIQPLRICVNFDTCLSFLSPDALMYWMCLGLSLSADIQHQLLGTVSCVIFTSFTILSPYSSSAVVFCPIVPHLNIGKLKLKRGQSPDQSQMVP